VKKQTTNRQKKRADRHAQLPEAFLKYLRARLPGFRRHTLKTQIALLQMILQAPTKYREHAGQEGWASFQATELEHKFGRGRFAAINQELGLFNIYEDQPGRQVWSKVLGLTKAYQLTDRVTDLRAKFLEGVTRRHTNLLSEDGKVQRKPPEQALEAKRKGGQTRVGWKVAIRTAVPVNQDKLKALMVAIEAQMYAQEHGFQSLLHGPVDHGYLQELLDEARTVYLLSRNKIAPGCVIHRYQQSESGRLYAKDVNLQNAYRLVRQAALAGFYDYDIENCHFTILEQMAARYGYACSAIAHYRKNKSGIRRELAADLGVEVDQVKTALIALVYGAAFSEDPDKAIPQILGSLELAQRAYANEHFRGLRDDVAGARTAILKSYPRSKQTIRNAVGLTMDVRRHTDLQQLAHLLQGIESQALDAAHRLYADSIVLLQHDGFTSTRELDHRAIEQAIETATGYRLEVPPGDLVGPRPEDAYRQNPAKNQLEERLIPQSDQPLSVSSQGPYAC
jgi:hypothetical protein